MMTSTGPFDSFLHTYCSLTDTKPCGCGWQLSLFFFCQLRPLMACIGTKENALFYFFRWNATVNKLETESRARGAPLFEIKCSDGKLQAYSYSLQPHPWIGGLLLRLRQEIRNADNVLWDGGSSSELNGLFDWRYKLWRTTLFFEECMTETGKHVKNVRNTCTQEKLCNFFQLKAKHRQNKFWSPG